MPELILISVQALTSSYFFFFFARGDTVSKSSQTMSILSINVISVLKCVDNILPFTYLNVDKFNYFIKLTFFNFYKLLSKNC